MKKAILFTLVLGLFACTTVDAQRASNGQRSNQEKRMNDDLNLNSSQASHMKALNKEYQQKANSIRSSKTLSKQQQNDQLQALRDEIRTKRMAILTATQREKFADMEKKHGKGYAYGDWKDTNQKPGNRTGANKGKKAGWEKENGPYKDRAKDGAYNERGRERFKGKSYSKNNKSKRSK